jgi:hypothetical protein
MSLSLYFHFRIFALANAKRDAMLANEKENSICARLGWLHAFPSLRWLRRRLCHRPTAAR